MSDEATLPPSAAPEPGTGLGRHLLERRRRPGVVDVGQARGLADRRIFTGALDQALLARLRGRRGTAETKIATGELVLVESRDEPEGDEAAPTDEPPLLRAPSMAAIESAAGTRATDSPPAGLRRVRTINTPSWPDAAKNETSVRATAVQPALMSSAALPAARQDDAGSAPVRVAKPVARQPEATGSSASSGGTGTATVPALASQVGAMPPSLPRTVSDKANDRTPASQPSTGMGMRSSAAAEIDVPASPRTTGVMPSLLPSGSVGSAPMPMAASSGASPAAARSPQAPLSVSARASTATRPGAQPTTGLGAFPRVAETPNPRAMPSLELQSAPSLVPMMAPTIEPTRPIVRNRLPRVAALAAPPRSEAAMTLVATPAPASIAARDAAAPPTLTQAVTATAPAARARPGSNALPAWPELPASNLPADRERSVGDTRRLVESVGRSLERSLMRARERRGVRPWKS